MIEFRADLHCHTTCSDGTTSPFQVVDLAKQSGLSGLVITDHDTIDAYPEVIDYAKSCDVEMVTGIEFSCHHKGKSIHILGYSFCEKNKPLLDYCCKHRERRITRLHSILKLLNKNRVPLTIEDVQKETSGNMIGRPHIALAMIKKGYVKSVEAAFKKFLGAKKPCFVPANAFEVEESIEIIHQAGGLAIIAHPHLVQDSATINDLLKMPFDGLEGYYSLFDKAKDLKWVKTAEQKNWLVTGGSDFHGDVKPRIKLGCSWVDKTLFDRLLKHYSEAKSKK